jgi:hypothetical protein
MSIPVNIPFVAGQDESWDRKLLPVGPVRGIRNMFFERNGRLVPRRACETESYSNSADVPDVDLQGLIAPNYSVTDSNNGTLAPSGNTCGPRQIYARESRRGVGNSTEYVLDLKAGAATFWQSGRLYYPSRDVGAGQDSSYCAFNLRGEPVRAYILKDSGTTQLVDTGTGYFAPTYAVTPQAVLEVCDAEMSVLFSFVTQETTGFATGAFDIGAMKMIHSTQTNTAIIFLSDQTGLLHKWYRVQTVAPYTVQSGQLNGVTINTNSAEWDISAIGGEDSWLLAAATLGEGATTAILYKIPFSGANAGTGNEVTRMSTTLSRIWNRGLACCGVTGDYYFFGGQSEVDLEVAELSAKRISGGVVYDLPYWLPSTSDLEDDEWYAPAVSCQATTEGTALHVGVSVLGSADPMLPRARTVYRSFIVGDPVAGAYPSFGGDGIVQIEARGELSLANPLPVGEKSLYLSLIDTRSDQDTDTEFEPGGVSHVVAPGGQRAGVTLTTGTRYRPFRLPSVAKFGGLTIWPLYYQDSNLRTTDTSPRSGVCWYVQEEGPVSGITSRTNETLIPGSPLSVCDGDTAFPCGFDSPPLVLSVTNNTAEEGGSLTDGARYGVQFSAEWRDGNGRVWRSQPSALRFLEAGTTQQINAEVVVPYSPPNGFTRVLAYLTLPGGSVLRYSQEYTMACGTSHGFKFLEDPSASAPTVYTAGGNVLPAEAPPNCTMVTRGRNRVWVAGLPGRPSSIQASQIVNDTIGIEWSNADNYFVTLPGEVTGIAAVDDALVAFTRSGVYITAGDGPNLQGLGEFITPQTIPSTVGCIDHKSIVVHEGGVFFQSQEGIQNISRGGGAPEFAGQPVMDTIKAYPVCLGSFAGQDDSTVRWLFREEDSERAVVVVFDSRISAWYVYDYDFGTSFIAGGPEMRLGGSTLQSVRKELNVGEDPSSSGGLIATQSLRASGLNGWVYGKKMNILGEFLGPCLVTIEFDFNDKKHLEQDTYTWDLTGEHYDPGDPVHLELQLPVYNWLSVNFRLYVRPPVQLQQDSLLDAATLNTFAANGITVYFDPAEDGPRLPSYQKG